MEDRKTPFPYLSDMVPKNQKKKTRKKPVQWEHIEQKAFTRWIDDPMTRKKFPQLDFLYAIPNGSDRHFLVGKKLKAEGLRPGVPDMCLAYPVGLCHGMYIEMKRPMGGKLSPDQKKWRDRLSKVGYYWVEARGAEDAKAKIIEYLQGAD